MIELYIENQQADINVGFSSLLTYAIDDVKDFGAKNTSFSKTMILPGTKKNNDLFGNIFTINRSTQHVPTLPNYGVNFNASTSAKAIIFSDNSQVFKGVLRLLEIVIDDGFIEYEVAVFGELGGFISKVGNLRLEDLNFSAYNHVYSISNIVASWSNSGSGAGYYYPLIDYGAVSTGAFGVAKKDYQFRTFKPALFAKEYIDKIIANAGYTYSSVFLNSALFKRLIIPNNQKALFTPKSQVFYTTANPTYSNGGAIGTPTGTLTVDGEVVFPGFAGGLFTTPDNKIFTYTGTSANFSMTLVLNGLTSKSGGGTGSNAVTYITVYKNGAAHFYNGTGYAVAVNGSAPITYNELVLISLATNDTFQVHVTTVGIKTAGVVGAMSFSSSITGTILTIDSPVPVLSPADLGDNILFSQIQPLNIFQKDFFSSILKMFNLLVTEDKTIGKHLIIEPYVDFFNSNPTTYIDWSAKVDRSKPFRIKPMSELNARYYEIKYKGDTDYYNDEYKKKFGEGYGDRVYDNGFEFAKEKESTEVIFAQSVLVGYLSEAKVVSTIFKRNNNLEDKIEHVIRIMQAKLVTGVPAWQIMNLGTSLGSYTNYPYAGHLDDPDVPNADLNFGVPKQIFFTLVSGNLSNNLFNGFYSPYFAEITDVDSKLVTAKMRFTRKDIRDLDFSKFVWIDGGLFRVNKIEDYNATEDDTCKVELLKTINTIY